MNLQHNKLWLAIGLGVLSGPALAATIDCTLTPANSVIWSGETLQLAATCEGGALDSITWLQGGQAIADAKNVVLSGDTSKPIYFTTTAGAAGDYVFTVAGTPKDGAGNTWGSSSAARVRVNAGAVAFGGTTAPSASTPAVNGECGDGLAGTTVTTFPSNGTLCASGKSSLVITGPNYMTWSCLGQAGGVEANCYVTKGVVYTVSVTNLNPSGGSYTINPSGGQVGSGGSATVTATPTGTNVATISGCGGTQSGNTFSIASVTQNCTVSVNFGAQPVAINGACGSSNGQTLSSAPTSGLCSTGTASAVSTGSSYTWSCAGSNGGSTASCSATISTPPPSSSGDPGMGGGLWVPPNMPNRTVADQSSSSMDVSYVPGCLNGQFAKDSSSACAAYSSYTGTVSGTSEQRTVTLGQGRQLVLRYKTPSTITDKRVIKVGAWNGGNVVVNMKVWLSTSPTATYDDVSESCRAQATTAPAINTASQDSITTTTTVWGKTTSTTANYCKLLPNTTYYFGMEFPETVSGYSARFQIDEMQADFLK